MTRAELDKMWQKALFQSVAAGEQYTRYHFATLVAAHEREACAQLCDDMAVEWHRFVGKGPGGTITGIAAAIRARSEA